MDLSAWAKATTARGAAALASLPPCDPSDAEEAAARKAVAAAHGQWRQTHRSRRGKRLDIPRMPPRGVLFGILCDVLADCVVLSGVFFTNNNMGADGAARLAPSLRTNASLTRLYARAAESAFGLS